MACHQVEVDEIDLASKVSKRENLHARNLTWNPKMKVWKMFFLFTGVILRFHVSFPGGTQKTKVDLKTNNMTLENHPCSMTKISSNGGFSIVMVVFGGAIIICG